MTKAKLPPSRVMSTLQLKQQFIDAKSKIINCGKTLLNKPKIVKMKKLKDKKLMNQLIVESVGSFQTTPRLPKFLNMNGIVESTIQHSMDALTVNTIDDYEIEKDGSERKPIMIRSLDLSKNELIAPFDNNMIKKSIDFSCNLKTKKVAKIDIVRHKVDLSKPNLSDILSSKSMKLKTTIS